MTDLWSYHLVDNVWTQLSPSGTPPGGRAQHVAVLDADGGRLLVHGGLSDQPVKQPRETKL